jgi:hypothetical protein
VIDIEHVHCVDALGEKALHSFNRRSWIIARNTHCVGLCDRLELRRVTVAESEPGKHIGRNGELAPSACSWSSRQRSPKEKGQH